MPFRPAKGEYGRARDFRRLGNWKLHPRTFASLGFLLSGQTARGKSGNAKSLRRVGYGRLFREQRSWPHPIRSDLSAFLPGTKGWLNVREGDEPSSFVLETAHR